MGQWDKEMAAVDKALEAAAEKMASESSNLGDHKRSVPDGLNLVINVKKGGSSSIDNQMKEVFSPRGLYGGRQRV